MGLIFNRALSLGIKERILSPRQSYWLEKFYGLYIYCPPELPNIIASILEGKGTHYAANYLLHALLRETGVPISKVMERFQNKEFALAVSKKIFTLAKELLNTPPFSCNFSRHADLLLKYVSKEVTDLMENYLANKVVNLSHLDMKSDRYLAALEKIFVIRVSTFGYSGSYLICHDNKSLSNIFDKIVKAFSSDDEKLKDFLLAASKLGIPKQEK